MTTYFDNLHTDVDTVDAGQSWDLLPKIEERCVFDCTIAAMQPGFPDDLRRRVHEVVLDSGVSTLPVNATPADFETEDQHKDQVSRLIYNMHTVFHDLAHRQLDGFGDDPRTPLHVIYARGEEEREDMVRGTSIGDHVVVSSVGEPDAASYLNALFSPAQWAELVKDIGKK